MTPSIQYSKDFSLVAGSLVVVIGLTGCDTERIIGDNPEAAIFNAGGASLGSGGASLGAGGRSTAGANGLGGTTLGTGGTSTANTLPLGPMSLAALSQCAMLPQGVRSFASQAEFQSAILGDWGLCKPPSVFGTIEAGLEITADGRWHKLSAAGGQTAAIATGPGNEGQWEIIDTSSTNGPGAYQLNLDDGSGTYITQPIIANAPDLMRLNNMGVYSGDYIRLGP